MLRKTILIVAILGAVTSEPIRRSITIPNDIVTSVINEYAELLELSIKPETVTSLKNLVKTVIGLKLSALQMAVKIVYWLKSNVIGIAIGGIIGLGICKVTGKCSLDYDHIFSKLYSVITPERLEMAENLFVSALRKFEEENEEDDEEEEEEVGYE